MSITFDQQKRIMDLYFKNSEVLYSHHYISYDKFLINDIIQYLVDNNNIFSESIVINQQGQKERIQHKLEFSNVRISPPKKYDGKTDLYPNDARINNQTYSCKLFVDIAQVMVVTNMVTNQVIKKQIDTTAHNQFVSNIPLMLQTQYCNLKLQGLKNKHLSKECTFDYGGYFIIGGVEKVIMQQTRLVNNKMLVFQKKDQKYIYYQCQVNSKPMNNTQQIQIVSIRNTKDGNIILNSSLFDKISIFIIVKALGMDQDKQLFYSILEKDNNSQMIDYIKNALQNFCVDDNGIYITSQDHALIHLSNKIKIFDITNSENTLQRKKDQVVNLLTNNFLQHVTADNVQKAYYVCLMIRRNLYCQFGIEKIDDRDSYVNKLVETAGDILFDVFKQQFQKIIKDIGKIFKNQTQDVRSPKNIIQLLKLQIIEQNMRKQLSKGTINKNTGVSQVLQNNTYLQRISQLRRVDIPNIQGSSASNLTTPRQIHPSSVGFLCSVSTPEHTKVGTNRHLSMIGGVSIMNFEVHQKVKVIMQNQKYEITKFQDIIVDEIDQYYKIFIDGNLLGLSKQYLQLYHDLRYHKQKEFQQISVVLNYQQRSIFVRCDTGRLIRPVFKVNKETQELYINDSIINNLNKYVSWLHFIRENPDVIEYMDIEEQAYSLIAPNQEYMRKQKQMKQDINQVLKGNKPIHHKSMDKDLFDDSQVNKHTIKDRYMYSWQEYTHCEIHESLLSAEIPVNIAFMNSNAGPRNVFQYSQGRQACSIYSTNWKHRFDNSLVLCNPTQQLVKTYPGKFTNRNVLSPGQNIIVAIACYKGFNQEDSNILNKTSIQQGMFRIYQLKKYKQKIQKNNMNVNNEYFGIPDPSTTQGMGPHNYDKLTKEGYPLEGTIVNKGDVIIGKWSDISDNSSQVYKFKNESEIYKQPVPGIIDKVIKDINEEGHEYIRIRLKQELYPDIGNKFCSQFGQKSTVGFLENSENLYYTKDGITPSLILNPNALPSRMTISQLMEGICEKLGLLTNQSIDATPFNNISIEDVKKQLEQTGYPGDGSEYLYNGETGEKLKTRIFITPTMYQALKHIATLKLHSVSYASRSLLTRQIMQGRASSGGSDGGIRLGEMEQNSICAHGMQYFFKEKFCDITDSFTVFICNTCGLIATRQQYLGSSQAMQKIQDGHYCYKCQSDKNIYATVVPYAFKLLLQELSCLNIQLALKLHQGQLDY